MMGDFNETAYPDEKKGGALVDVRKCQNFNCWISDCNLLKVTTTGTRSTLRGPKWNGMSRVFKKLDRVLCNVDWRLKYHEGFVKVLPGVQSDHHPIIVLLEGQSASNRNRPFRFEAAWTSHVEFDAFLHSKWEKDKDIVQSLHNFTTHLKKWNKETFGDIFKRKEEIMGRLNGIQNTLTTVIALFLRNWKRSYMINLLSRYIRRSASGFKNLGVSGLWMVIGIQSIITQKLLLEGGIIRSFLFAMMIELGLMILRALEIWFVISTSTYLKKMKMFVSLLSLGILIQQTWRLIRIL